MVLSIFYYWLNNVRARACDDEMLHKRIAARTSYIIYTIIIHNYVYILYYNSFIFIVYIQVYVTSRFQRLSRSFPDLSEFSWFIWKNLLFQQSYPRENINCATFFLFIVKSEVRARMHHLRRPWWTARILPRQSWAFYFFDRSDGQCYTYRLSAIAIVILCTWCIEEWTYSRSYCVISTILFDSVFFITWFESCKSMIDNQDYGLSFLPRMIIVLFLRAEIIVLM